MTDAELVRHVCHETAALHERVAIERADVIVQAAHVVRDALVGGRKVLVFGNGGSAADAQHFAAELVGQFGRTLGRRALPVIALTADLAVVSAVANDFGFAAIFARQIDALGVAGDVALAITTSGSSANVNEGLRWALDRSLTTVALTGADGGQSGQLADVHVNVPDANPQRVQEVQQTVLHLICELVERGLSSVSVPDRV
ncbi:MAG: SIS domain-containing protein [Vicinamibacterales bacterium]